ncbi:c-type cytochrome [Massilia sp. TN1-12]|uniref:c-type cytochrome n=1 Tax=Massilia paldalensis TaxID=3377675 RepID=UPI00384D57F0
MNERLFSLKNRWFTISVGAVVLIAVLSIAVGFVWVPRVHGGATVDSLWDAICSAAGAPARYRNATPQGGKAIQPSDVIVNSAMMGPPDAGAVRRGTALAQQCSTCHDARGPAAAAIDAPRLAGEPASSTYKQLRDFKAGHRTNPIMQAMAANLSEQDMRDLAAYYAAQPRATPAARPDARPDVPRLVSNGAPIRNIGACATCHGAGVGRAATPVLDGLSETYLRAQLTAFRAGTRANDINRQMRNAAHGLTDAEIALVARYYASR